ncbi:5'-nucleotidase C-terminal domain-containing protein [Flavobacteriaceae bacterium M23B6Z8]
MSCKEDVAVASIEKENIPITDTLQTIKEIESFIEPYRSHINKTLDSVLSYNPVNLTKDDTPLNTALGNWMADVVYEAVDPIYFKRTGKHIDFVLLNHGGIRANLNKGAVTARNAYELMPFENKISVIELSKEKMLALLDFLISSERAHPLSKQLTIELDSKGNSKKLILNDIPIDSLNTFHVATSDYLANLGDQMNFFEKPLKRTDIDYLIRNIIIDAFKSTDTIQASYDNRFIKEK